MSFEDFTLVDITLKLGLTVMERSLFADAAAVEPSAWLTETLKETAPLALSLANEKARSEMLIAPVLVEVRRAMSHRVAPDASPGAPDVSPGAPDVSPDFKYVSPDFKYVSHDFKYVSPDFNYARHG